MRTYFSIIACLVIFTSCQKNQTKGTCSDGVKNQDEVEIDCGGKCDVCGISYPASGFYGTSVLDATTTNFSTAATYSMHAQIPPGSIILVKFQSTGSEFASKDIWYYESGTNTNLMITEYDGTTGQQRFQSSGGGNIDLKMSFKGVSSATIEIYENGATEPSRTKNITWS